MSSRLHLTDCKKWRATGKMEAGQMLTGVCKDSKIAKSFLSRIWNAIKTLVMCTDNQLKVENVPQKILRTVIWQRLVKETSNWHRFRIQSSLQHQELDYPDLLWVTGYIKEGCMQGSPWLVSTNSGSEMGPVKEKHRSWSTTDWRWVFFTDES